MKFLISVCLIFISEISLAAVSTVCSDANDFSITIQDVDIRERFLPSKANLIIRNNGDVELRNEFRVEGYGPTPEATNPTSGPSSMADGPYMIYGYLNNPKTGDNDLYTQFLLKALDNGLVVLIVRPEALLGNGAKSLNCNIQHR